MVALHAAACVFTPRLTPDSRDAARPQQRVVASERCASLSAEVSALQSSALCGYASRLSSRVDVVSLRDALGSSRDDALMALVCAANDAAAAAALAGDEACDGASPTSIMDTPRFSPRPGGKDGADEAAGWDAAVARFRAASCSACLRLADLVAWDVERVLWRCVAPPRFADAPKSGVAGVHPGMASAASTVDDYLADLRDMLLPAPLSTTVAALTRRVAVTYAAMLLSGPPLSAPPAAPPPPEHVIWLVSDDQEALRRLFGGAGPAACPAAVLDAACETMVGAAQLAGAGGPASARKALRSLRARCGPSGIPASLVRRMADAGIWATFGARLDEARRWFSCVTCFV